MKKVEQPKYNVSESLTMIAEAKNITREDVAHALEEAIAKAYVKFLGGKLDGGPDEEVVYCHVDPESGDIKLGQTKKVVAEVEDDYFEIDVEDANDGLKKAKYKVGDIYDCPAEIDELKKVFAVAVKNNLRQKLAEVERAALYEKYKDRIGELIVGTVEKADDRSVVVSIGQTTVELSKRELIGNEIFHIGDMIKVYIQEVKAANETENSGKKRGPMIEATRASEGFLKRLFDEEIHEIYDGTVVIKAIARKAGVRAKVAVTSNNPDVDATGACIGQGGSRIQRVVSQLGNGRDKEKIDIIEWSDYFPLFVINACRPAQALGVAIDEENKSADIIIPNGTTAVALGKFRSNLDLTRRITGYEINFIEEDIAAQDEVTFMTKEEAVKAAEEERLLKEREAFARRSLEEAARREAEAKAKAEAEEAARKAAEEAARIAEEAARKADMPTYEAPKVAPKASANPEEFPAEAINPAAAALAAARAAKAAEEAAAAAKAAKEAAEEARAAAEETPVETVEVKTTTNLSDLEKELESSKEKKTKTASKKRPHKITEEEVKREAAPKAPVEARPVYTEEELNAIEEEENASAYDDVDDIEEDYSDYDQYYGDDQ